MPTFIKTGFWEKTCQTCNGYKGWLNLDDFVSAGTSGTSGMTGSSGTSGASFGTSGTSGMAGTSGNSGTSGINGTDAFGVVTRWSPVFQATGLTFTGSGTTYPTYNSRYVQSGKLVSFWIEVDMTTVTNFGTGQLKVELPVLPMSDTMNHFPGWVWRDPAVPADDANHIIVNADHLPNTTVLDLHFLVGAPANPKPIIENKLSQGAMGYDLTTVSKIYINGTYITA